MAVTLTMAGATGWLVSTEVGQQALLEQQVGAMESFGVSVTDELYDQLAGRLENATYSRPDRWSSSSRS